MFIGVGKRKAPAYVTTRRRRRIVFKFGRWRLTLTPQNARTHARTHAQGETHAHAHMPVVAELIVVAVGAAVLTAAVVGAVSCARFNVEARNKSYCVCLCMRVCLV